MTEEEFQAFVLTLQNKFAPWPTDSFSDSTAISTARGIIESVAKETLERVLLAVLELDDN